MNNILPKVRDYMTSKVVSVKPDIDVCRAIELLLDNKISGAPVVNNDNELVGILSEKDCIQIMANESFHDFPCGLVSDYMTEPCKTLHPNDDIYTAVDMFLHSMYRRAPVLENKKLVGIISRRDILKAIQKATGNLKEDEYQTGYLTEDMKKNLE
ncbi:MAG: CBS domain-containing protein [Candidatus Marinimicrobia bacterium]|nr:CBS domain-containing protein [Candidatus Neomarinimicrobiota bacterium]MBL7110079.1 CBS domain-containing protein [Candidatus Neomarinimicrobiota bacterium]